MREGVLILDFGSQYSRLIARRVREARVYSELHPWTVDPSTLPFRVRGIVLSGGPASVYAPGAPQLPPWVLEMGVPVLGICYGMQLLAHALGGEVAPADRREYGLARIRIQASSLLFEGLPEVLEVWMSHGDHVTRLPEGFRVVAASENAPVAAMEDPRRRLYGVQFHPEVAHTPRGKEILARFLHRACGLEPTWTPASFIEEAVAKVRAQVGEAGKVVLGLSGGVDSAVTAALLHRAIGDRLVAIFVDHGLLRAGEAEEVVRVFRDGLGVNLRAVDAADRFFAALRGVVDPEEKRRIIGELFVRIFEEEARRVGDVRFLAQGTTYPDVIESTAPDASQAARIKTHHNVGGLPERMEFEGLVEPLRYLFKDEVREVGLALGLPESIVWRQPFPGPGLAVRILGEVTPERAEVLRAADRIVREEFRRFGWERRTWQAFAVLLPVRTVGVMGDARTYAYVVAVRAVQSQDGMTADWARVPHDLLAEISRRIVNEVPQVNRVVYDITSKPPATIEWE